MRKRNEIGSCKVLPPFLKKTCVSFVFYEGNMSLFQKWRVYLFFIFEKRFESLFWRLGNDITLRLTLSKYLAWLNEEEENNMHWFFVNSIFDFLFFTLVYCGRLVIEN